MNDYDNLQKTSWDREDYGGTILNKKITLGFITTIMLAGSMPFAGSAVQAESVLDELKEEKQEVESRSGELDSVIGETEAEMQQLAEEREVLEGHIQSLKVSISELTADLTDQSKRLEETNQEIERLNEEIDRLTVLINQRNEKLMHQARATQTQWNATNIIHIILSAEDLSDLISRVGIVSQLVSANRNIVEDQIRDQKQVEESEEKVQAEREEVVALLTQMEETRDELAIQQIELDNEIMHVAELYEMNENEKETFVKEQYALAQKAMNLSSEIENEEERIAEEKRLEEQRIREEEERRRAEEEAQRLAAEEEARQQAEREAQELREEEERQQAAAERREEEERQQAAAERRSEEEQQAATSASNRSEEESRQAAAERRAEEERQQAAAQRREDEQRQQAAAERRAEEERQQAAAQQRRAEEQRQQAAAQRREEARRQAEAQARKEREEAEKQASAPSNPAPSQSSGWIRPASGILTSGFGYRIHPVHGTRAMHSGIDIAGSGPIRATRGGTVTTATYHHSLGYYVVVDHGGGYRSMYAHMTPNLSVSRGQTVSQGQQLGIMGTTGTSTGVHLHFEIHKNGRPVNPAPYVGM